MTDQPEITAVLLVDVTSSRCGHCKRPVLVEAVRHVDVSGWEPQPGAGCRALFVATRSTTRAVDAERLLRVRPDLPVDTPAP